MYQHGIYNCSAYPRYLPRRLLIGLRETLWPLTYFPTKTVMFDSWWNRTCTYKCNDNLTKQIYRILYEYIRSLLSVYSTHTQKIWRWRCDSKTNISCIYNIYKFRRTRSTTLIYCVPKNVCKIQINIWKIIRDRWVFSW